MRWYRWWSPIRETDYHKAPLSVSTQSYLIYIYIYIYIYSNYINIEVYQEKVKNDSDEFKSGLWYFYYLYPICCFSFPLADILVFLLSYFFCISNSKRRLLMEHSLRSFRCFCHGNILWIIRSYLTLPGAKSDNKEQEWFEIKVRKIG